MAKEPLRSILAPVDLSSCSRAALEFACSLAASCGATVDVLFVHSDTKGLASPPEPAEIALGQELHRFVAAIPGTGAVRIRERLELGDAREQIVSLAERERFDAIVLGTHGRTGRVRTLAGSVAEAVVRTASGPVVTVRERA